MAEEKPNRVQGMVRSVDQYRNGDPKAICAGSPAQILYAMTDARHDILALWAALESAASSIAAKDAEIARLRGKATQLQASDDWHYRGCPIVEWYKNGEILEAALRDARSVIYDTQQAVLFDDDNGQIGVSEDAVISSYHFSRICASLRQIDAALSARAALKEKADAP